MGWMSLSITHRLLLSSGLRGDSGDLRGYPTLSVIFRVERSVFVP